MGARQTVRVNEGWTLVACGAIILGVGAFAAAWAWLALRADADREGVTTFFVEQSAMSSYLAVAGAVLGTCLVAVGAIQAGVPIWVPMTIVVAVAAITDVGWQRRRRRAAGRLDEDLRRTPEQPWSARVRARGRRRP